MRSVASVGLRTSAVTSSAALAEMSMPRTTDTVSALVGTGVGSAVGAGVGIDVGSGVGISVGIDVGLGEGTGVGIKEGTGVGSAVGAGVGINVGSGVGLSDGTGLGMGVGYDVGAVGTSVGTGVGTGGKRYDILALSLCSTNVAAALYCAKHWAAQPVSSTLATLQEFRPPTPQTFVV